MMEASAQDHEQALANRARPDIDETGQGAPASVGETVIFRMRDNFHDFTLDLETVLRCLALAESEGAIPKLPEDWWLAIRRRYGL